MRGEGDTLLSTTLAGVALTACGSYAPPRFEIESCP
jgi:hypothetical protein